MLYSRWPGSRISRSARLPETCLRERARWMASAIPPTTSAAITSFISRPKTKPTTAPMTALITMNPMTRPPTMAASL